MMNKKPDDAIPAFLHPGGIYFGDSDIRIRTVLGSCVAMVFWHPTLLLGGMCHYMLPSRVHAPGKEIEGAVLDGRYGDESMSLMVQEMHRRATQPREYHVKVFGGGNMFPGKRHVEQRHVGLKNIEAARKLIDQHGLYCVAEHLGDVGYRNVIFHTRSGDTWVHHDKTLCGPALRST
jgi:chemotaxis protein CheD